jgi:hypothetical protein
MIVTLDLVARDQHGLVAGRGVNAGEGLVVFVYREALRHLFPSDFAFGENQTNPLYDLGCYSPLF